MGLYNPCPASARILCTQETYQGLSCIPHFRNWGMHSLSTVHPGEIIMVGKVDRGSAKTMKDALKKASIKLPTPCKVIVTKGKDNKYICQSSSNCNIKVEVQAGNADY